MTDRPFAGAASRTAFRFCFVYFGLYIVTTQMLPGMLPIPGVSLPELNKAPLVSGVFLFIAKYVLRLPEVPVHQTGSGDTLFDWVQAFSLLLIATVTTLVWTLLASRTASDAKLNTWFRFFIRWAVATTMLTYGFAKVIPLQMPTIALSRLVQPFGDFSPMAVLWSSIGAAPGYEIFVGCAEVVAGVLLFLPRTTLFGSLVALMCAIGVFALNMTYDVPVKLFSFHLILLSLLLLAPNLRRLFEFFIAHRTVAAAAEPPIGQSMRVQRHWVIGQLVFGVYLLLVHGYGSIKSWNTRGGGAPQSPLFGIWAVDESIVNGDVRPPLLTDPTRWRHVIFQRPTSTMLQMMNDQFTQATVKIDTVAHTIAVVTPKPPTPTSISRLSYSAADGVSSLGASNPLLRRATLDTVPKLSILHYTRPTPTQLVLDGTLYGDRVHLTLRLRPVALFVQKSRGFNWIQEYPVNR